MRGGQGAVSIVLILALLAPAAAWAAPVDSSDWTRVQRRLERGARITVTLGRGETITGRLVAAESYGLAIKSKGTVRAMTRADVLEVRRAGRSPLRKLAGFVLGVVIGAVIGTLLGGSIGASSCSDYCELAGLGEAILGFFIGAVGGGAGGVAIAAQGQGAVVYRAAPAPAGTRR
jgi:hypothetical protein